MMKKIDFQRKSVYLHGNCMQNSPAKLNNLKKSHKKKTYTNIFIVQMRTDNRKICSFRKKMKVKLEGDSAKEKLRLSVRITVWLMYTLSDVI